MNASPKHYNDLNLAIRLAREKAQSIDYNEPVLVERVNEFDSKQLETIVANVMVRDGALTGSNLSQIQ